jgi:hypothetical protein
VDNLCFFSLKERCMNKSNILFVRPGLHGRVLFLVALLVPLVHARALILTTNCPDLAVPFPQPKRIQSECPATVPLGFVTALPQFSSGGVYHIFANGAGSAFSNFGLARSDTTGLFEWKVACSNGFMGPLSAQGRFSALQDLPAGISNVTCLGVYDRSGATFVPVFENRLPIHNRYFVGQAVLNNGTLVLSLNRSNSVSLVSVNPSGSLLWAKQLTSTDLPVVSPGPADPGRSVTVSEIGTNGILLSLSANQNLGSTNAVTVLIRLDSNGTIQWSKRLQIPLVDSTPSSSGPQVLVYPGGEVLVTTSDYELQGTTVVYYTHLTKVAMDGNLAWSRKLIGGILGSGPRQIGPPGSLLLDLISVAPSSSHSVSGILGPSGQMTTLVQVDPPVAGRVRPQAVSISAGKVYFAGNSGSTPVVGASSLTLTNFTAREYIKGPLNSQTLTLMDDGHLAFSGMETNLNTFHFLLLNSDLSEYNGCGLFSGSTLTASPANITIATNVLTLADVVVTNTDLTVSLVSTQLEFYLTAFQEQALCTTGCDFSLAPGGISLGSAGGSTNVNVRVASLSTCNWTVTNPCADWITVSPMNGSGSGQLTFGVGYNPGNARSCTLTIAGQPFTVTQAGDVRVLADAVDAPALVWTTGGNADWSGQTLVTHDGVDAGQSGPISDNQESWLETAVVGPGTLTFWWKVSSQAGSDRLRFYINGTALNNINGEVDWRQMSYTLAAGTNVLRWRYTKDLSGSAGQDRGWVDQVVWSPSSTCSFSLSSGLVGVGPGGGGTNLNITVTAGSNCGWTVFNPCPEWLTVSATNGTGDAQVTVLASANSTGSARNCTLTIAGSPVAVVQAGLSSGDLLVQYDPTGQHNSGAPVLPSLVAANITASSLQEVGFETTWNNTDTLPVGRIPASPTADLNQYLTFTVGTANGQPIAFKNLSYDKQSYLGAGPTLASVRSSVDFFGADLTILSVDPLGFQSLSFDLSVLAGAPSPVTFRIYFYGAATFTDWADLVSTGKAGNGLRVTGSISAGGVPTILTDDGSFGFSGGNFGFNITGPSGRSVVIERSTDLQTWTPVKTNTFGAGPLYFSDPQSGFSGVQFYRGKLQ